MHHICHIIWQVLFYILEAPFLKVVFTTWFDIVHVDPDILVSVRPCVGVPQSQRVQELMSDNALSDTPYRSLKVAIRKLIYTYI